MGDRDRNREKLILKEDFKTEFQDNTLTAYNRICVTKRIWETRNRGARSGQHLEKIMELFKL